MSSVFPNGITAYKSRNTAGYGVAPTYAETITAVQTTAIDIVSYTPSTNAGRYRIGGVITLTSGTNTGTVGFALDYTDSQGTAHSEDVMPLIKADGSVVTTGTAASTEWKMIECEITINASGTPIIIETLVAGSVNYTASAYIQQVG